MSSAASAPGEGKYRRAAANNVSFACPSLAASQTNRRDAYRSLRARPPSPFAPTYPQAGPTRFSPRSCQRLYRARMARVFRRYRCASAPACRHRACGCFRDHPRRVARAVVHTTSTARAAVQLALHFVLERRPAPGFRACDQTRCSQANSAVLTIGFARSWSNLGRRRKYRPMSPRAAVRDVTVWKVWGRSENG